MRLGRIHRQFQIIESQSGDFGQLVADRFDREIHCAVLHDKLFPFADRIIINDGSGSFSFKPLQTAERMIVCENRALSECIRDRCKRTATGWVLQTAKKTQLQNN